MTTGPPMMSMLESFLKLSASREQAISANMANIDTPGYRTREINLEGEFNKVMSGALRSSHRHASIAPGNSLHAETLGCDAQRQFRRLVAGSQRQFAHGFRFCD